MSQRSTIITALITRLQTITVANGYATAIGTKVYSWRTTALAESSLPCLIVNDTEISRDYEAAIGRARNSMTVEITGLLSGSSTVANARSLEEDIYKCLHGYETVGGTASWLTIDKSSILIEQNEQIGGAVTALLTIQYDTARNAI